MTYYGFACRSINTASILLRECGDYDVTAMLLGKSVGDFLKYLLEVYKGKTSRTNHLIDIVDLLEIKELDVYRDLVIEVQDYYYSKGYPSDKYIPSTRLYCIDLYNRVLDFKGLVDELIEFK